MFLRNVTITLRLIRNVESIPDNALLFHKCEYDLRGISFYDHLYLWNNTIYCTRHRANVLHRCIINI